MVEILHFFSKALSPEPQATTGRRENAESLQQCLHGVVRTAREQFDVARMQQADEYKGGSDIEFTVSDLVLRRSHPLSDPSKKFAASLAHKWEGPYIVIQKLSRLSHLLRKSTTGDDVGPVHIADLQRYYSSD